jgi:hypothetical protein
MRHHGKNRLTKQQQVLKKTKKEKVWKMSLMRFPFVLRGCGFALWLDQHVCRPSLR